MSKFGIIGIVTHCDEGEHRIASHVDVQPSIEPSSCFCDVLLSRGSSRLVSAWCDVNWRDS